MKVKTWIVRVTAGHGSHGVRPGADADFIIHAPSKILAKLSFRADYPTLWNCSIKSVFIYRPAGSGVEKGI